MKPVRRLITKEMKQSLIDLSRQQQISISALVRKIFIWFYANMAQGKILVDDTLATDVMRMITPEDRALLSEASIQRNERRLTLI